MTMPTFLVIGANKGGTTALASYLGQHPDIYISSIKEPMFFMYENQKLDMTGPLARFLEEAVTDLAAYQKLFADGRNCAARGEASTGYLFDEEAPSRIHQYLPSVKLIAVLRNPSERAFSNYLFYRQHGVERRTSFSRALREDLERWKANQPRNNWYLELGMYHKCLSRYFALFDRAQVRVYLYEDWRTSAEEVIRDIFEFLGVDETFRPDMTRDVNVSVVARSRWLQASVNSGVVRMLPGRVRGAVRQWNQVRPRLQPADRKLLIDFYREDIQQLEKLIDRDLSTWLTIPANRGGRREIAAP